MQMILNSMTVAHQLTSSLPSHLTCCLSEVHIWCASRRLQLNSDKTKTIWFGARYSLSVASDFGDQYYSAQQFRS